MKFNSKSIISPFDIAFHEAEVPSTQPQDKSQIKATVMKEFAEFKYVVESMEQLIRIMNESNDLKVIKDAINKMKISYQKMVYDFAQFSIDVNRL